MGTPKPIADKVRQLGNDVDSIYEILVDVQATQRQHGRRLDVLDGKVTALDGKVTALDGKVTALDGKVTALDGKVTALDGKVTALDGKVADVDGKVDGHSATLVEHGGKLDEILALLRDRPAS